MSQTLGNNSYALGSAQESRLRRSRWRARLRNFSFGEKVIVLYFGVFYFAPITVDFFFDLPVKYVLSGDLHFFWPFILAVAYLFAFLFVRRLVGRKNGLSLPFRDIITSRYVIYCAFGGFLFAAYQFGSSFETSFRHNDSYSTAGLIPIVCFALKNVCAIYVFASLSKNKIVRLNFLHYILFILGLYFAFVSSNDVIHAFLALYAFFAQSKGKVMQILRRLTPKFGLPAVIVILPAVTFGGVANKVGIEAAISRFSDGGFQYFVGLFANRIFYHSYSFAYHINNFQESFALGWQAIEIAGFQTFRRFQVLLGADIPNETLQTVSRLNYLQITAYDNGLGAGASPGLLGSLFYFPGGVAALPIHMLYVFVIVTALDKMMGNKKYTLPVYLGGLVVLQALVDTIVDNLNPFSVGFVALMMVLILSSGKVATSEPKIFPRKNWGTARSTAGPRAAGYAK